MGVITVNLWSFKSGVGIIAFHYITLLLLKEVEKDIHWNEIKWEFNFVDVDIARSRKLGSKHLYNTAQMKRPFVKPLEAWRK